MRTNRNLANKISPGLRTKITKDTIIMVIGIGAEDELSIAAILIERDKLKPPLDDNGLATISALPGISHHWI